MRAISSRTLQAARAAFCFALAVAPGAVSAQTDYYNTDRGRPLAVEDASVIERHAFELQAAPLRVQRVARGVTHWGIAPELAWGLLPRTQLELSLPLAMEEDALSGSATTGLAGVELEALHQLNVESLTLPAFAVGAGVHLRAGPLAPRRAVATVRALATRTLSWGRVHVNGAWSPGDALEGDDPAASEANRWFAGVAIDHAFVFRSLLVGADVTARESLLDDGVTEWRAGAGIRRQLSPRLAIDAGIDRRISAGLPGWGITFGAAYAFALPGSGVFHPRPSETDDRSQP